MENEQINVQSGKKTAKSWANLVSIALTVLAFVLMVALTTIKFKAGETKSYLNFWDVFAAENFQFVFVIGYVLLIASVPLLVAALVFEKKNNAIATAAAACQFLAAIAFVLTPIMFGNSMGGKATMEIGLAMGFALSLAASLFSFIYAFSKMPITVHQITEDAILVATAFALNFLKVGIGATGGSINLQLLPIYLIALRHGPLHGLVSGGIVLGLLTCFTDAYGFAYFPFDYLIGLGSAGVLGFFKPLIMGKNQKTYNIKGEAFLVVGLLAATVIRMVGGMTSSIVYYEYSFIAAFDYNILYVGPSAALCLVLLMALYGPLLRVNKLLPAKEQGN